jgi:dTDP-4-amino-4,6-dideoxy-D-galactose acyltransferase
MYELRQLDWDTNFFGFRTGKADISLLNETEWKDLKVEIESKAFSLVYLFVNPEDQSSVNLIEGDGVLLADDKVTFITDLAGSREKETEGNIITLTPASLTTYPEIESIAYQSGAHSRFYIDPGFDRTLFRKLYFTWLEKSLSGEIAKTVFGYENDGRILGLVTLGVNSGRGNIGLIAVDESSRGLQIGKNLVQAVFNYCGSNGIKEITVTTQHTNKGACNFYLKLGFREYQSFKIYHYWNSIL